MEFQVYDYIIQNARKAEDQQNFSRVKGEHFKGITDQQICIFKVFKGCLCYYIRQYMLVLCLLRLTHFYLMQQKNWETSEKIN